MKVIEHIQQSKKTLISFEVLPPLKGKGIETLFKELEILANLNPAFINVTHHRKEKTIIKNEEGKEIVSLSKKRPGTIGICAVIKYKYNIDPIMHLICGGFTREETEEALVELSYLGIDNILALRGDAAKSANGKFYPESNGNAFASELVAQIQNMNQGIYLDEKEVHKNNTNFCIGVAGYPEKHFETIDMDTDLQFLKQKIDKGASYIITQMFFDNQKYFEFVNKCRAIGITVPIIPGLKPITLLNQLVVLPKIFHLSIPEELQRAMNKCTTDDACKEVGKEWLLYQSRELKKYGVPILHYYTLTATSVIVDVVKNI